MRLLTDDRHLLSFCFDSSAWHLFVCTLSISHTVVLSAGKTLPFYWLTTWKLIQFELSISIELFVSYRLFSARTTLRLSFAHICRDVVTSERDEHSKRLARNDNDKTGTRWDELFEQLQNEFISEIRYRMDIPPTSRIGVSVCQTVLYLNRFDCQIFVFVFRIWNTKNGYNWDRATYKHSGIFVTKPAER